MQNIAQRIIMVVNATEGNMSAFARAVGVSPQYVSKFKEEPSRVPSDRIIRDICATYNVSETWLRTGEGEMFRPVTREEEIAERLGRMLSAEDDTFRKRFLEMLLKLNDDQWELLEEMAKKIAGE